MARIRTVKPELFKHEDLFDLERQSGLPVRVSFIGLFTCCDRGGRFKWRPRALKLDIIPYDDCDFSRVLDALASRGFVIKYASEGEDFGFIPTFLKHQVINNKESKSVLPEPDESLYISSTSTREARVDDATGTRLLQDQGEGKGKEGKGREGKESSLPASGEHVEVFDYWKQKMNHPHAKLDAKREKAIKARLKDGYTVGDLCSAVDGCKCDPWSQGANDNRTVYDDIELICRDGPRVDKFITKAGGNQSPVSHLGKAGQATAQNAMRWLEETENAE